MKIACVGYRDWALNIYNRLSLNTNHHFLIFHSKEHFEESVLYEFNPEVVLFYGWSWIVPDEILKRYKCLMLHPSDLPSYRGGSPLQNQIIDGIKRTKVTIFIMNTKLDSGDIVSQMDLPLDGSIGKILHSIEEIGFNMSLMLLNDLNWDSRVQDDSLASYCKRRNPVDSEISINEITTKSAEYLHNKIRMLGSPYPAAYITCGDGKRVYIEKSSLDK